MFLSILIIILIAIIIGIFVFLYSIKKTSKEGSTASEAQVSDSRPKYTRPTSFTMEYRIQGVKSIDTIMDYAEKNIGYYTTNEDAKLMCEPGEKTYEYEISCDKVFLTGEHSDQFGVLIEDTPVGKLSKKDTASMKDTMSRHEMKAIWITGHAGMYSKLIRNPDYDPEYDDEDDKYDVEWDELSKPSMKLVVKFSMDELEG